MKKNYFKITFDNCNLDYDYTICNFWEVNDYLQQIETTFLDDDPKDHEEYGKPQVTIEPILLSDKEYADFVAKLEKEA